MSQPPKGALLVPLSFPDRFFVPLFFFITWSRRYRFDPGGRSGFAQMVFLTFGEVLVLIRISVNGEVFRFPVG